MNILLTICARGGSKGIPGKNIKPLNGQPLLAYTINTARAFIKKLGGMLSLSTDSDEIREMAATLGLHTTYNRPDELATDKAGKIGAIHDLLLFEEKRTAQTFDYIIDLDVTSPLRTVEDLTLALKMLEEHDEAVNVFSVSPANRNPYFNMVEETAEGFVKVVKDIGDVKSRQQAPKVYDMNASFYVFKRQYFDQGYQTSTTDKSLAYLVPHLCFDLDHPVDFTIMQLMMENELLDFEL